MKKIINLVFIFLMSFSPLMAKEIVIPEGTEIEVKLTKSISSTNAYEGQRVQAKIINDVLINDDVVIKANTPVKTRITGVEKKKRLGKGGALSLLFINTTAVDGTKIPLSGGHGASGRNNTGSTVALTMAFGGLGLLRKGKSAMIPAGREFDAIVDEDVTIEIE